MTLRNHICDCGAPSRSGTDRRCLRCYAAYMREYYARSPETTRRRMARYRARHPDRVLSSKMRAMYGITLEQYREMYVRQGGLCAVCETRLPDEARLRPTFKAVIEHEHATGIVRGITHATCNHFIAFLEVDGLLPKAQAYIARKGLSVVPSQPVQPPYRKRVVGEF